MTMLNVLECPKMDWSVINGELFTFACPKIKWRGFIQEPSGHYEVGFHACETCEHKDALKRTSDNYIKQEVN